MYKIAFLLFLCAVYGQEEAFQTILNIKERWMEEDLISFLQKECEQCHKDGAVGTCIIIHNCAPAIEGLKSDPQIRPQICGFLNVDPIVCCVTSPAPSQSSSTVTEPPPRMTTMPSQPSLTVTEPPLRTTTTQRPPVATTQKRGSTATVYEPEEYDYVYDNSGAGDTTTDSCEALSLNLTSKKTGRKAWDKCIEYQETLIYPCERSPALTREMVRVNYCTLNGEPLIVGGVNANFGEFSHMVLLGLSASFDAVHWECGGTIISEKFVLTAAHCTMNKERFPVTHVLIGVQNRTENTDNSKVFKIKGIFKHPDYKSPEKYNDIALLETEKTMPLSKDIVPACLNIGRDIKDDRVIATGWGLTEYKGRDSNMLQKVILEKFTQADCSKSYPADSKTKGFDDNMQICYGSKTKSYDTCQGDSGGPIQIKSKEIYCMYTIIGVTSFGSGCGFAGKPGIYTRVSHYVPWIESIVWPQNE